MNKNEIIETIFKSEEYNNLLLKLVEQPDLYLEDFKQDLMLILLEMESEFIEDLWNTNRMKFYITRIITNQIYSRSSPFYKTYKKMNREVFVVSGQENYESDFLEKFEEQIDDDFIEDFTDGNILTFINKNSLLTWYETNILSIYYKLGEYSKTEGNISLRTMEKEYGIHYVSLHLTIKSAIDKVKAFIENQIKNN